MGNHDQRSVSRLSNADMTILAIVLAAIARSYQRPVEDAFRYLEADATLSDVGLILGFVPFKLHGYACTFYNDKNSSSLRRLMLGPKQLDRSQEFTSHHDVGETDTIEELKSLRNGMEGGG
jgi:hypothetical protein